MIYDLVTEAGDFAPWNGVPLRSLVICTHMRSGSTLLGEALHSTGRLGTPMEYFASGFRPAFAERWGACNDAAYLAALFEHRTSPSGIFSTKLFWSDLQEMMLTADPVSHAGFGSHVAAQVPKDMYRAAHALLVQMLPDPVWLRLERKDVLRQAVSWYLAGETGAWRAYADRTPATVGKKPYDYTRILSSLLLIESVNAHWQKFFEVNSLSPVIVHYEALSSRYPETVCGLLQALGEETMPVAPPRLHRQSDAHSDAILARFEQEHRQRLARGTNDPQPQIPAAS